VGTVGRLDPIKDQALLIRAFARLRARVDRALLAIVGGGPERQRLETLAAGAGVGASVLFLGERSDVAQLLPGFDVFALSSRSEGTPITLLEAMASSTPIVSTAVGGIPEILADGAQAILVAPEASAADGAVGGDDAAARLAAALERVLLDPELAGRLARAARERFLRELTLEAACGRYLEIYRELAASARPGKGARKDHAAHAP
jgi:glycosyltransferase involved in cell wall biosynthesis